MKKVFVIFFLLSIAFVSCTKESIEPKNCNCGLILDDRVEDYSILIRNSCTGNQKWFTLYRGDWMNANPGEKYCITNTTSW